jgi:hypothetical protein
MSIYRCNLCFIEKNKSPAVATLQSRETANYENIPTTTAKKQKKTPIKGLFLS